MFVLLEVESTGCLGTFSAGAAGIAMGESPEAETTLLPTF